MGTFTVRREVEAPASEVWQRLVHWPNHGRWVPLTTVTTTSATPGGVGATFVGRTAIGRLGFDDSMVVTGWQLPSESTPGRCEIQKTGRVVLGDAWFSVAPLGPSRCVVEWSETLEVAGIRRLPLAGRVNDFFGRLAFGRMLAKMAAEAESAYRSPP